MEDDIWNINFESIKAHELRVVKKGGGGNDGWERRMVEGVVDGEKNESWWKE